MHIVGFSTNYKDSGHIFASVSRCLVSAVNTMLVASRRSFYHCSGLVVNLLTVVQYYTDLEAGHDVMLKRNLCVLMTFQRQES